MIQHVIHLIKHFIDYIFQVFLFIILSYYYKISEKIDITIYYFINCYTQNNTSLHLLNTNFICTNYNKPVK